MGKAELCSSIASAAGLSNAEATRALQGILRVIVDKIAWGDAVILPKFGTFELIIWKGREIRNVKTGERMAVSTRHIPRWRAAKGLRAALRA